PGSPIPSLGRSRLRSTGGTGRSARPLGRRAGWAAGDVGAGRAAHSADLLRGGGGGPVYGGRPQTQKRPAPAPSGEHPLRPEGVGARGPLRGGVVTTLVGPRGRPGAPAGVRAGAGA